MDTIKWVIDPAHSEIGFKVKHLMFSNVKGHFTKYEVTIGGEDYLNSPVIVVIDADSIFTKDADRDTHLKSADFFDVENYKSIIFEKKSVEKVNDDMYKLTGLLIMKNVSKEVTLDVEYGGNAIDPWGNERIAFSITGKINRKDWGLNWNTVLEAGGVLVGEEVVINADIEFIKQA